MKTTLILFLLTISSFIFSQEKAVRYYEGGLLEMGDFRGIPIGDDSLTTNIFIDMAYSIRRIRTHDSIVFVVETKNLMYPEVSFIREGYKDAYRLAFNQTIFNLAEIERRKLQAQIIQKDDFSDAEELLQAHFLKFKVKAQQFMKELSVLEDSTKGSYLAFQLAKTVEEIKNQPHKIYPNTEPRNFKGGYSLGYSHVMNDDALFENIKLGSGFSFGADIFYKSLYFLAGVHLQPATITENFNRGSETWLKGDKGSINYGNFALGFILFESNKSKLTPFVGFSNYVIRNTAGIEEFKMEKNGLSYGFNYDFKFLKYMSFSLVPYREKSDHFIRLSVTNTHIDYQPLQGNLINVMIGYGYVIGGQKLKKPISK